MFVWLTLLSYFLYCGGLEPNLQYLQGMPIIMSLNSALIFERENIAIISESWYNNYMQIVSHHITLKLQSIYQKTITISYKPNTWDRNINENIHYQWKYILNRNFGLLLYLILFIYFLLNSNPKLIL